jgi:hypothetical protein
MRCPSIRSKSAQNQVKTRSKSGQNQVKIEPIKTANHTKPPPRNRHELQTTLEIKFMKRLFMKKHKAPHLQQAGLCANVWHKDDRFLETGG